MKQLILALGFVSLATIGFAQEFTSAVNCPGVSGSEGTWAVAGVQKTYNSATETYELVSVQSDCRTAEQGPPPFPGDGSVCKCPATQIRDGVEVTLLCRASVVVQPSVNIGNCGYSVLGGSQETTSLDGLVFNSTPVTTTTLPSKPGKGLGRK